MNDDSPMITGNNKPYFIWTKKFKYFYTYYSSTQNETNIQMLDTVLLANLALFKQFEFCSI